MQAFREVERVVREHREAVRALLEAILVARAGGICRLRGTAREDVDQRRRHSRGQHEAVVSLEVRAVAQVQVRIQILRCVERADHPVELVGLTGETQLLGQLLELVAVRTGGISPQHVARAVVGVLADRRFEIAPRGDRGDLAERRFRN